MATFTAQFPELLESRAKKIFFLNYQMQSLKYPMLFATVPSRQAFEDRIRVAGLGTFATKPEGTPVTFDDPIQGTRRRVTHQTFALGYRPTMEAIQDDLWNILDRMPADLGDSGRDHQERLAWDVINDGFTGARHTGLDNLSLFNGAHPSLRPEVANGTNILSPPIELSVTGLEDMMTLAKTTLTEEGRFAEMNQSKLVIHPANDHVAHVLLNTEFKPGTANNDVSTVVSSRSGLVPLSVPYKTSETSWSVHDVPGRNTLQWNDRMSMEFKRADDADTFDQKHYGTYRASVMFSEWRGNWGSDFS